MLALIKPCVLEDSIKFNSFLPCRKIKHIGPWSIEMFSWNCVVYVLLLRILTTSSHTSHTCGGPQFVDTTHNGISWLPQSLPCAAKICSMRLSIHGSGTGQGKIHLQKSTSGPSQKLLLEPINSALLVQFLIIFLLELPSFIILKFTQEFSPLVWF